MEVLEFKNTLGKTCNYMTVSNILKYYGFDMPEEYVFLLLKAQYKKEADINIPFFSKNAFEKIGFNFSDYKFKEQNEFRYLIQKIILNKTLIIANVDSKVLPYFPNNLNTLEEHPHTVIIHGYKENQLLVSDVYVPFYPPECYTGWIEEDTVYRAVAGSKDPRKLFTITKGNCTNISLYDIFMSCFMKIMDVIINENLQRRTEADYNSQFSDTVEGCEAIISTVPKEEMKLIARKTRAEWLSFEGPAQTRDFLAQIFYSMKSYCSVFEKYANDFKLFNERWNGVANALIKLSVVFDAKYFKFVADLYSELLDEEIEYMKKLKNSTLCREQDSTCMHTVLEVRE